MRFLCALAFALTADAAVIFDNLPPVFIQPPIGIGAIPVPGVFLTVALGFTPGQTYTLTGLDVPLVSFRGTPAADISVWEGAAEPSSLLESFTAANLPTAGLGLIPLASSARPTLSAGRQYWIVLTGGAPDAFAGWGLALPPDVGLTASKSHPGDPWTVYVGDRGSLRITGDPAVPEPSLFGPGALGLALILFSRASARARAAAPTGSIASRPRRP